MELRRRHSKILTLTLLVKSKQNSRYNRKNRNPEITEYNFEFLKIKTIYTVVKTFENMVKSVLNLKLKNSGLARTSRLLALAESRQSEHDNGF